MSIPKFVSAEEYSRQSGMGVELVKKLCRNGELEHCMTDGGYYKIKVDSDSVPIEKYIEVKEENSRLKIILETIANTAKQIKWKERKQMKKEDLFYKKVGQAVCIVGMALLYVVPILYSIIH